MPRVVHFEIPADDLDRAVRFYRTALGWELQSWPQQPGYWLATTGPKGEPGIDGAVMQRMPDQPCTINTVGVPSLEEALKSIVEAGGKVISPTMDIPTIGRFAYCKDTEGNNFGVLEPLPQGMM